MNCEFSATTVHGYADGELDAVRAAEFQRHLEGCAECQGEVKKIESLRRQLREGGLFEQASPQLRGRIQKQMAKERAGGAKVSGRRWFSLPAIGTVAAAAAAIAIVFLVFQTRAQSTQVAAEVVDAHIRSLQPGHLMDVVSTDQHTVKPWFDGKLNFIPPVRDFSQQGFPLVGGRLEIIDGHSAAAIVYGRRKHFINLFVWPDGKTSLLASGTGSRQGYNWIRWKSGEMQFWLVSDAAAGDLRELEGLLRR